jgi:iron complex outermembrane recepter protein
MRALTLAGLSAAQVILFTSIAISPAKADALNPLAPLPDEMVIVVRGDAKRRTEAPVSGFALGSDTIERLGITSLDAVAIAAPGLSMINDQDPGTNIVSMRGVTTDRLQQAAIAYVIDGVPLADTEFFTGPLFDLARIDVLRGPQGARYGKSAAGGAVEISTEAPASESGNLGFAFGDGGLREAKGGASWDLGGGARVRLSGRWTAAEGWITNRTLNRVVDAEESIAVRGRLQAPLWGGELDATLFAMEEDGGAAWASSGNITGAFGGQLRGDALQDPIGDFEGRARRSWVQGALRYRVDLNGATTLTAIIAQDRYRKRWQEELDYRPGPLTFFSAPIFPDGLQPIRQPTDIDATTVELRLTHSAIPVGDGAASVRYGLFAQRVERVRLDDFGPLLFGASPPRYHTEADQRAAFLGATWRSNAWTIEADLRLDQDVRTQTIMDSSTGARLEKRERSFTQTQPRLAASYRLTPEWVVYSAYGEGFRSGGFNPRPTPANLWRASFEPETTRSLELGAKLDWGGWVAEFSAFRAEISNYQNYTFLEGQSVTLNVDAVAVRGGEWLVQRADLEALEGSLTFSFAGAIAESKVRRFLAPDPFTPVATRDYSGKRVPNAPLWSAALSADWDRDIAGLNFAFGATLNAAGETFFEIDNALRAPPKRWLDLRASLSANTVTVALIATNATDERWAISAFGQGMLPLLAGLGPNGPFDTYTVNRGRQLRLEVRKAF